MNASIKTSLVLGISLLLAHLPSASAATASDHLAISVNVVATCSMQSAAPPFGSRQSGLPARAGNLFVNCSNGATYEVAFDPGSADIAYGDAGGVTVSY